MNVLLIRAESVIQRDSLLQMLMSYEIDAFTTPRVVSNKIADSTIDLGLEGYSVMFDGFPIYVNSQDESRAQELVKSHLVEVNNFTNDEELKSSHFSKYYRFSMFSLSLLPLVFHVLGFYHLLKAFKKKEKIHIGYFIFSTMIYLTSAIAIIAMFIDLLRSK